jgi:hypothetical protein
MIIDLQFNGALGFAVLPALEFTRSEYAWLLSQDENLKDAAA